MILGAIADDFAGGMDLAGLLQTNSARTVFLLGDGEVPRGYDAAIVSVKSRAVAAKVAAQRAVDGLERLQICEPQQIFFQFSGADGPRTKENAGPVTDALLNALGEPFTVAVPADPAQGVTQSQGQLLVDGVPLRESQNRPGMRPSPAGRNVVSWLRRQTPSRVGLLPRFAAVEELLEAAERLRREGVEIALADAATEADLDALADAFAELPLLAGSSGMAAALPRVWKQRGWCSGEQIPIPPKAKGAALILAGSESPATVDQWTALGGLQATVRVPALLQDPELETGRVLREARAQIRQQGYAVVRASATGDEPDSPVIDERHAAEELAMLFGVAASTLSGEVTRFVVSGSDTAGAVLAALGVEAAEVGRPVSPGVPALHPVDGPPYTLVWKAGTCGDADFFRRALDNT